MYIAFHFTLQAIILGPIMMLNCTFSQPVESNKSKLSATGHDLLIVIGASNAIEIFDRWSKSGIASVG